MEELVGFSDLADRTGESCDELLPQPVDEVDALLAAGSLQLLPEGFHPGGQHIRLLVEVQEERLVLGDGSGVVVHDLLGAGKKS